MKGFLKKVFPFISAAASLGGPLGVMAANAVGAAIGADKVDASPDGLAAAVAGATPEQLAKLREAEQGFKVKMAELGFNHVEELERLEVADRDSARSREVSVRDLTPRILAYVVTAGFFGCIFWLFKYDIPVGARDTILFLLGALSKMTGDVFAYYYGSSHGSESKNQIISDLSNGKK